MNVKEVKKLLKDELHPSTISIKRNGNILLRWGFFYTHGKTTEDYVARVTNLLFENKVVHKIADSGKVWKAFRGGASVANQSHWYVEVSLNDF